MLKKLPEVGELVRYLGGECESYGHELEVGNIYKVTSYIPEGVIIYNGLRDWYIYGEEHDSGCDFDKYELVEHNLIGVKEGDFLEYLGGDVADTDDSLTEGRMYEVLVVTEDVGIEIETDYLFKTWTTRPGGYNEHCFKLHPVVQCTVLDTPEELSQLDEVNSPSHYNEGKYETIDVIEHMTRGYEGAFTSYCVGNVVKYIDRAPFKHESPIKCLEKAQWYLEKTIESIREAEEAEEAEGED